MFDILERHCKVFIASLALLLTVGYVYKLCRPHEGDEKFQYGFYAYEKWKGGPMRWTWRKACARVEATSDLFEIKVAASGHNSTGPNGLLLKIFLQGEALDEVHFFKGGYRTLYYCVPDIEGKEVEIRMEVDRTFNPLRMEISEDTRELGVAVSPVTFLKIMPKDGVGFYLWETTALMMPEWKKSLKKRFRWTGKQASQSTSDFGLCNTKDQTRMDPTLIAADLTGRDGRQTPDTEEQGKDGVNRMVFLMCGHPDIEKAPVAVRILGDGLLLRHVEFEDHGWKKVAFKETELEGKEVITFEVSRTWNPRKMGVSMDERDLGVAVAVP